jgi:hypothetical protein
MQSCAAQRSLKKCCAFPIEPILAFGKVPDEEISAISDSLDVCIHDPTTELDSEHDFPIINSPVVVKSRRVDISSRDGVSDVEAVAQEIVADGIAATVVLAAV